MMTIQKEVEDDAAEIAGYQRELAQARADIETVSRSRDAAIADRTAYADRYGAELRATVERLTRERDEAQASRRRFPIMGGPSIPWRVIAPHEAQARINHDQSLERLAQRGGLSPMEAHFVLADQRWRGVVTLDEAPWLAEMNAINAADDQQAKDLATARQQLEEVKAERDTAISVAESNAAERDRAGEQVARLTNLNNDADRFEDVLRDECKTYMDERDAAILQVSRLTEAIRAEATCHEKHAADWGATADNPCLGRARYHRERRDILLSVLTQPAARQGEKEKA